MSNYETLRLWCSCSHLFGPDSFWGEVVGVTQWAICQGEDLYSSGYHASSGFLSDKAFFISTGDLPEFYWWRLLPGWVESTHCYASSLASTAYFWVVWDNCMTNPCPGEVLTTRSCKLLAIFSVMRGSEPRFMPGLSSWVGPLLSLAFPQLTLNLREQIPFPSQLCQTFLKLLLWCKHKQRILSRNWQKWLVWVRYSMICLPFFRHQQLPPKMNHKCIIH